MTSERPGMGGSNRPSIPDARTTTTPIVATITRYGCRSCIQLYGVKTAGVWFKTRKMWAAHVQREHGLEPGSLEGSELEGVDLGPDYTPRN